MKTKSTKTNTTPTSKPKQICTACGKNKNLTEYYKSDSPLHSSTQRVPICKICIKENSKTDGEIDLEKFESILRQLDKTFLISAYNSACTETEKAIQSGKGRKDLIGNYFKNIQSLPQYDQLNYADSEAKNRVFPSNSSDIKATTKPNPEDMVYSLKWKGLYSQVDIDSLDDYYAGLERDYNPITQNHKDYAKKISKASLHMDKCFEDMMSGINGSEVRYKNAREAFDSLCKSAKFSESTRSMNDIGLSSFSIIGEMVENHGWIPEHIPVEKDEIDQMLEYLSTINKSV